MADEEPTPRDSNQTDVKIHQPQVIGSILDKGGEPISDANYNAFYQLQVGGLASLRDLADQFRISLVNSGLPHPTKLASLRDNWRAHPLELKYYQDILECAYRTSCVLVGWTILEALANIMAELAIAVSNQVQGSPPVVRKLTLQEVDYLREQETYFDAKKHLTRIRHNSFVPILDKLVTFPRLLGDVLGIEFSLDRSGRGWQAITRAKNVRDLLTHPKLGSVPLNSIIGSSIVISVQDEDLIDLVIGMTWFLSCTYPLVESVFAGLVLGTIQITFIEICDAFGWDSQRIAEEYNFRMDQMMG